jgi:hypothetical protein
MKFVKIRWLSNLMFNGGDPCGCLHGTLDCSHPVHKYGSPAGKSRGKLTCFCLFSCSFYLFSLISLTVWRIVCLLKRANLWMLVLRNRRFISCSVAYINYSFYSMSMQTLQFVPPIRSSKYVEKWVGPIK